MKKIITSCALMALIAFQGQARELSENEAMNIAQSFFNHSSVAQRAPIKTPLQLTTAYKASSMEDENLLYVFNRGENDGFIIIAGDDTADEMVLGYSDNGTFDYELMPENMRYWLNGYENEIAAARHAGQQRAKAEAYVSLFNKNVGPLVEARWSQDEPYNGQCPEYGTATRCATGCVATAMAQIMYHHKYPEHGVGTKEITSGASIEVIDFANTTYEWDLMTPVYSSLSTPEECDAVATLMYHVGRSVNMMYGSASGAVSADAAHAWATYWNYDKGVIHRDRQYYTIEEWEKLIIEEIDNSRPILYHGQSPEGGHAFVLDGYNSEGYVHINWGWNGMSNGYFKLHALTPEKQGIGGFSGGYNTGQGAIFGIQPNKNGKNTIEITAKSVTVNRASYNLGEEVATVVSGMANSGWSLASFSVGYMIYDTNETLIDCIKSEDYTINASSSISTQNIPFTLPTTLANGEYRIYLAHTDAYGNWKHVAMELNTMPYLHVQVTDGVAEFITDENGEIFATAVECLNEEIYTNRYATFSITMSNPMLHEYFGSIYVSIYESKGKFEQRKSDAIALSIPAGKEITIEIPIKIEVSKGSYCVFITDGKKKKMSESYPITVLAEPAAAELQVSNFRLITHAKDLMQVEYTITNNGGEYNGKLRPWVLFTNHQSTSSYVNTEIVSIKQGESMNFTQTWAFEDGVVGEDYICSLWYDDSRTGGMSQLGNEEITFKLDKETGLDDITTNRIAVYPNPTNDYIVVEDAVTIDRVAIYNMQGILVMQRTCNSNTTTIDVSSLPEGIYWVVTTTAQGNTLSKVIIN